MLVTKTALKVTTAKHTVVTISNNITVLSPIVRGGPKPKSYSTMTVNKYAINSPSKLTTYEDVSATCRHSYQNHPRETRKGGQNHLRETFF
ncbi:uncharacterized protein LOC142341004 isoform X3 [Convolutriloba macropyga]|uniref:uncharacterized protein LOC142341004 isoform X3 n=1 Tax=Convolutriloba macropyga TaxID=536237 RepID=UPI003F52892A